MKLLEDRTRKGFAKVKDEMSKLNQDVNENLKSLDFTQRIGQLDNQISELKAVETVSATQVEGIVSN